MEDAHTRIFGNSGEESRKIQLFPLLFGEFNRPVSFNGNKCKIRHTAKVLIELSFRSNCRNVGQ